MLSCESRQLRLLQLRLKLIFLPYVCTVERIGQHNDRTLLSSNDTPRSTQIQYLLCINQKG